MLRRNIHAERQRNIFLGKLDFLSVLQILMDIELQKNFDASACIDVKVKR